MSVQLKGNLPELEPVEGDDYVISGTPTRLNYPIGDGDMDDDPMTQMASRVFGILMYGTIYSKELKRIFINGYLDNAKFVGDHHISLDTKAFLCQDHTNNLELSEWKFRFYADVGLLSELVSVEFRKLIDLFFSLK